MASLKAERGFRILIIDACRNNWPLSRPQVSKWQTRVRLSPVTITTT